MGRGALYAPAGTSQPCSTLKCPNWGTLGHPHHTTNTALFRSCLNGPNGYRAGWYLPINHDTDEEAKHNADNTAAGTWYRYSIPAMMDTDENLVVVGVACGNTAAAALKDTLRLGRAPCTISCHRTRVHVRVVQPRFESIHCTRVRAQNVLATLLQLPQTRSATARPYGATIVPPKFESLHCTHVHALHPLSALPFSHVLTPPHPQIFPTWKTPNWPGRSRSGDGLPAYYLSMKKREGYDEYIDTKYTGK
jgi:hypothetical protein